MALSNDQQLIADKFMLFLNNPNQSEFVVEGHPGTGKSFLTKHLIELIRTQNQLVQLISPGEHEITIHCTATTNKAAEVLTLLSEQEAGTIHSLLGLKVSNNNDDGTTSLRRTGSAKPVKNSVIFIDEASYIDKKLLKLIRDGTMGCKIIFIGDPYQLTSIHESVCPVFTDIPLKGTLTDSQRFSNGGPIDDTAINLRDTIRTETWHAIVPDGKIITQVDGPTFKKEVNLAFGNKAAPKDHNKILAWSNSTVLAYNDYVRDLQGVPPEFTVGETVITNKPILDCGGWVAYNTEAHARVTRTTPGTRNGIEGWNIVLDNHVETFQPAKPHEVKYLLKELARKCKNKEAYWSEFFKVKEYFGDLRASHACTVYKAQGSTYHTVFVDLPNIGKENHWQKVARMLHVAITRASDRIVLYGDLPKKYKP